MRFIAGWIVLLNVVFASWISVSSHAASYPDDDDQTIQIKDSAGRCLTFRKDSWGQIEEGARVELRGCQSSPDQVFVVEHDLSGNSILHPSERSDLCLGVSGARQQAGIEIMAETCSGNPNQSFQWARGPSGRTVQMIALNSKLCWDTTVEKRNHSLIQNTCNGSSVQNFRIWAYTADPAALSAGTAVAAAEPPAILLPPTRFTCSLTNEYGIFHTQGGPQSSQAQAMGSAMQDCLNQSVPRYVCNRSGRSCNHAY